MGRIRERMYDKYNLEGNHPDDRYNMAYKRVKRIKGFYIHALVYVLVNAFIIISSANRMSSISNGLLNWDTYSTAIFWGIGLLAHGVSVFGRNIFFGQNWEEKKIKELMEKEKSQKWE